MDALSTTGYGYMGEGEQRQMKPIPSEQKLKDHQAEGKQHAMISASNNVVRSSSGGQQLSLAPLSVSFEDELYARTARSIHLICVRQLSLNDAYHLMELQNANGAVISFDHISAGDITMEAGGLTTWLEAGARVFQGQMRKRVQNPIMVALFPKGVPFGLMGDGSNDRSLSEQEAVCLRFISSDGKPFNIFSDLAELDLTTSKDGHSPDAQCIAACYEGSLDKLNEFADFLFCSNWKKAAVGMSFDGVSVMLGTQNGAAAKLKGKIDGYCAAIHAVAHVEQLGNADAFKEIDYYEEWRDILQEVYTYYHLSGKKRHGLEAVAKELLEDILKLSGTHGIRWAAAQLRTIKAILTDLPSIVVDLEKTVKSEVRPPDLAGSPHHLTDFLA